MFIVPEREHGCAYLCVCVGGGVTTWLFVCAFVYKDVYVNLKLFQ